MPLDPFLELRTQQGTTAIVQKKDKDPDAPRTHTPVGEKIKAYVKGRQGETGINGALCRTVRSGKASLMRGHLGRDLRQGQGRRLRGLQGRAVLAKATGPMETRGLPVCLPPSTSRGRSRSCNRQAQPASLLDAGMH